VGLRVGDLTREVIDEFFAVRGPSRSRCRTARSLQAIMAHLRSIDVAAPAPTLASGRTDAEAELLDCYRRWRVAQRGLTSTTADQYVARMEVCFLLYGGPTRISSSPI
jgi:hypothetical protein